MNQTEYELIAETIVEHHKAAKSVYGKGNESFVAHAIATRFADKLAKAYPRTFDRQKFLKACGL